MTNPRYPPTQPPPSDNHGHEPPPADNLRHGPPPPYDNHHHGPPPPSENLRPGPPPPSDNHHHGPPPPHDNHHHGPPPPFDNRHHHHGTGTRPVPVAEAFDGFHQDTYDQPPPVQSARASRYNNGGTPYHRGGTPYHGARDHSTPYQRDRLRTPYQGAPDHTFANGGEIHDPRNGPAMHPVHYQRSGEPFYHFSGQLFLIDGAGTFVPFDPQTHYRYPNCKLFKHDGSFSGFVSQYLPPQGLSSTRRVAHQGSLHSGTGASSHGGSQRSLNLGSSDSQEQDPPLAIVTRPVYLQGFVTTSVIPESCKTSSTPIMYALPEDLRYYTSDEGVKDIFERAISVAQGSNQFEDKLNDDLSSLRKSIKSSRPRVEGLMEEARAAKQNNQSLADAGLSASAEEMAKELRIAKRKQDEESRLLKVKHDEENSRIKTKYFTRNKDYTETLSKADKILDSDIALVDPAQCTLELGDRVCDSCIRSKLKGIMEAWECGNRLLPNTDWLLNPVACKCLIEYVVPHDTLQSFGMLCFAILLGFNSHGDMVALSRDHHYGGLKLLSILGVCTSGFPTYSADVKIHRAAGVVDGLWKVQYNKKANHEVLAHNFATAIGGCYLLRTSKRKTLKYSLNKCAEPFEEGDHEQSYGERLELAAKAKGLKIPSTDGFFVDTSEGQKEAPPATKPTTVHTPSTPNSSKMQDAKPAPQPTMVRMPPPSSIPTAEDGNTQPENQGYESDTGLKQSYDSDSGDSNPPTPLCEKLVATITNDEESVDTQTMVATMDSPTSQATLTTTKSPIKKEGDTLNENEEKWLKERAQDYFQHFKDEPFVHANPKQYILGAEHAGVMMGARCQTCWEGISFEIKAHPANADISKDKMDLIQKFVYEEWSKLAEVFSNKVQQQELEQ